MMQQLHSISTEDAVHAHTAGDVFLRKLAFAGVFAAASYVAFTFLSVHIPTPGGQVTVHLGNACVALGALVLGIRFGAVAGALGLTIGDLFNPVYLPQAPLTFLVKLMLGVVVALIAHNLGHITHLTQHRDILRITMLASFSGMLFNAVVDPIVRYWYKILILGRPAAEVSFRINVAATLINSVVSFVVIVVLYTALRAPLKKMGLWFEF